MTTALFIPNGGVDKGTMLITPRRIEGGWPAEIAAQLPNLTRGQGVLWHLPFGCLDDAKMEFDSLVYAKRNKALSRVVNVPDFVACMETVYRITGGHQAFYYGCPEHSDIMVKAHSVGNFVGLYQRIDACIAPIIALRSRGVPVRLWLDASAIRDSGSLSHFVWRYISNFMPCGVEARPTLNADWANRPYIDVMAWRDDWHSQSRWPNIIPSEKLLGPQWLICRTADEAKAEIAAGRNVLTVGKII